MRNGKGPSWHLSPTRQGCPGTPKPLPMKPCGTQSQKTGLEPRLGLLSESLAQGEGAAHVNKLGVALEEWEAERGGKNARLRGPWWDLEYHAKDLGLLRRAKQASVEQILDWKGY